MHRAWAFASSRGTTTYEAVLYTDGTTSCNCPGWVFERQGKRGCKHTKMIENGTADVACVHGSYTSPVSSAAPATAAPAVSHKIRFGPVTGGKKR